jgi:hypothetical protein
VPSVLGLLEAREKRVREKIPRLREEAERVQTALGEVERALQRLVDACATVAEVLAEPLSAVAEPARSAVAGQTVPWRAWRRRSSRRTISGSCRYWSRKPGREGLRCQQLTGCPAIDVGACWPGGSAGG